LGEFRAGLFKVCHELSQDIVRNGEGTAHVIEVNVRGAIREEDSVAIGKAIVNAPLCKAAIFGNDPNTGRIIQAIGDICGTNGIEMDPEKIEVSMGGEVLYSAGKFNLNSELEEYLSTYLKKQALTEKAVGFPDHYRNVVINVDLKLGNFKGTVYGSDLSYEYVRENGDYRS
jgi:glutamate N-acetyltransferase / amino-acid N-acetyltransferase